MKTEEEQRQERYQELMMMNIKRRHIDPELFEMLDDEVKEHIIKSETPGYLLSSNTAFYNLLRRDLPKDQVRKVVDSIIRSFPDMTGFSSEKQARLFSGWRHNFHLYDAFPYNVRTHTSENKLLDEKNIEEGVRLANFLAQQTTKIGDERSFSSIGEIVHAFMDYNWDHLEKRGFDAPLVMPEEFHGDDFIYLINEPEFAGFLRATTMKEWLEVERTYRKLSRIPSPLTTDRWERIVKKYPDYGQVISEFVYPIDSDVSVKQTQKRMQQAKKAKGKTKGIFVDIDGTLIKPDGQLDTELYDLLCRVSQYEKVTIFTGGDIENQKFKLSQLGMDTSKFPIVSKDDYRGHLFTGIIIDDIRPELQGFIAGDRNTYCTPNMGISALERALEKMDDKSPKTFQKVWDDAYIYAKLKENQSEYWDRSKEKELKEDERLEMAIQLYKKRYPKRSLLQKMFGLNRPDRSGAMELAKDFHDETPNQRTALKFKSSKKSERE